jgi:hypothetical protein
VIADPLDYGAVIAIVSSEEEVNLLLRCNFRKRVYWCAAENSSPVFRDYFRSCSKLRSKLSNFHSETNVSASAASSSSSSSSETDIKPLTLRSVFEWLVQKSVNALATVDFPSNIPLDKWLRVKVLSLAKRYRQVENIIRGVVTMGNQCAVSFENRFLGVGNNTQPCKIRIFLSLFFSCKINWFFFRSHSSAYVTALRENRRFVL